MMHIPLVSCPMNNVLKLLPQGTFLKNSCRPIDGFKYDHPLDGHGYINSFKITPNSIQYKGFRQQTAHFVKENQAKRALYRGIGTNSGNRFFINNFNNVSVFVDQAGNTFSCGEGGVPYHIDVERNRTIGPVELFNLPSFISTNLPFLPLSAHPTSDGGNVFNFGCFVAGLYILKDNNIVHTEFFPDSYYAHDFKMTESYFVFFLNKVNFNAFGSYFGKGTILDSIDFIPGSSILLIDRESYDAIYIPVGESSEKLNAMHIPMVNEVTKNDIEIHASLSKNMDLKGARTAYDFTGFNLHKITLNLSEATSQVVRLMSADAEMPVVSEGAVFLINENTLFKYDTANQTCMKLHFDEGVVIEEPCVVDDVIIVIGHFDIVTYLYFINKTSFNIMHTEIFPFKIPYGFHGVFKSP